jgi:hypothetical protein
LKKKIRNKPGEKYRVREETLREESQKTKGTKRQIKKQTNEEEASIMFEVKKEKQGKQGKQEKQGKGKETHSSSTINAKAN